jgi:hypothetical protein
VYHGAPPATFIIFASFFGERAGSGESRPKKEAREESQTKHKTYYYY